MKASLPRHDIDLRIPPVGVHLRGDRLVWNWPADGHEWPRPRRTVGPVMLDEFLQLADDEDGSETESFAGRWGVLGWPSYPDGGTHEEPLERWRDLSRQVGAIIKIAGSLASHSTGPLEQWRQAAPSWMSLPHDITGGVEEVVWEPMPQSIEQDLKLAGTEEEVIDLFGRHLRQLKRPRVYDPVGRKPVPPAALRLRKARQTLGEIVNWWLEEGRVLHAMTWDELYPQPLWRGRGVRAALAFYLVSRITETTLGLIQCSHCGASHPVKRRPKPGDPNYCGNCHDRGIPELIRKQRWREGRATSGVTP